MSSRTFPLVRGRVMRVTRLDACGKPVYGGCSQIVTDGFISVGLSAVINEGESISVVTANGKTCVSDQPSPEFQGYTAELTFCNVDPELFAMLTGQATVNGPNGDVVGFRMNTGVDLSGSGFALEVWAGVPGQACDNTAKSGAEPAGYLLLPFLKGGVIGDFTIENAAINFSITGAATKGGSGWGVGPYNVVEAAAGGSGAGPLATPIGAKDHLHVQYVEEPAPKPVTGCRPLLDPTKTPLTAAPTVAISAKKATLTLAAGDSTSPPTAADPLYIEWGDGQITYATGTPMEHTYAAAGTYSITVHRGTGSQSAQAVIA